MTILWYNAKHFTPKYTEGPLIIVRLSKTGQSDQYSCYHHTLSLDILTLQKQQSILCWTVAELLNTRVTDNRPRPIKGVIQLASSFTPLAVSDLNCLHSHSHWQWCDCWLSQRIWSACACGKTACLIWFLFKEENSSGEKLEKNSHPQINLGAFPPCPAAWHASPELLLGVSCVY